MDYQEMISALEEYFEGKNLKRGDALRIADAMKTLLAERDAAVSEIHGQCILCVNKQKCLFDDETRRNCSLNKWCNWQWRGPQMEYKED